MHRGLGEPLPHQLANAPRVHPSATPESAQIKTMRFRLLYGISTCFQVLSPSDGQVTHVLLTRSATPLSKTASSGGKRSVRLACIRHAASVRPEPGSNSHKVRTILRLLSSICLLAYCLLVKMFIALN